MCYSKETAIISLLQTFPERKFLGAKVLCHTFVCNVMFYGDADKEGLPEPITSH